MKYPLFATVVGSKLYGSAVTGVSDTDFKGICLPHIDEIVGMRRFEQDEFSNGLTGADKIEGTLFDVRKFMEICYKGNPTLIELACAAPEYWTLITPVGHSVLGFVKANCLTKALFKPYSAYHMAQMRKMQSMTRVGSRAPDVEKYGYDVKFASHAWRLANQCVEIMRTGKLNPTMTGDVLETCMKIRRGEYSKDDAMALLDKVDKEMYAAYNESKIPDRPDFDRMNVFLTGLYTDYISGKLDQHLGVREFPEFQTVNSLISTKAK